MGYDVLVANTNHNVQNGNPKSGYADEHMAMVWQQLIEPALDSINSFAVIAHSHGGDVVMKMLENHEKCFYEKCFDIAFTDSASKILFPFNGRVVEKGK